MTKEKMIVEWLDSSSHSEWHDYNETEYAPTLVTSIGFVVQSIDEHITLVPHIAKSSGFGDITIPRVNIIKAQVLQIRPGVKGKYHVEDE